MQAKEAFVAPHDASSTPGGITGSTGFSGPVPGAAGFICGYPVAELLEAGYEVVGVDNYSKYGPVKRSYDTDPRYRLVEGDAKNIELLTELATECDHLVAGAAMIGGISYFHEFAYDLLAENERICAATFDAAISAHRRGRLNKITVISSSMVYEWRRSFRPRSASYEPRPVRPIFQKLATEFLHAAHTSSTSCRTPSCGPSTASASASGARCETRRS